jgi:riboflavin kinase/FMN adenylyltransferase
MAEPLRETAGGVLTADWRAPLPDAVAGGVAVVGNFDGVHRGHLALIQQARELAISLGGPLVVVTFDPHPLQLLAPERFLPQLTTSDDRASLLREAGADVVVTLQTDRELLDLSAKAFFQKIIGERLRARGVVEGFNFRFGKDRQGDLEMLRSWCAEKAMAFRIVEPFAHQGVAISSSSARTALEAGDIDAATALLGRNFHVHGMVVEGAKRGRTIGFPTANLGDVQTLLPADGVYAVRAIVDGRAWPAAANIGPNPTFGENARKIEVHLIDFVGDLYGRSIRVEFARRLRSTRPFASVEALIAQVKADVQDARELLA